MRTTSKLTVRLVLLALFAIAGVTPVATAAQMKDADLAGIVIANVRGYVSLGVFDDLNIAVNDRAVTLTGRVTMPFKRDEIAKRVARIDGVRSVVNDIQVLPNSLYDSELRVRLAQAIYGHPAFWRDAAMINPPIHIVVERGRVTLTG
jgi:hypothetical protein